MRQIAWLVTFLMFVGCGKKRPEGILSESEMVSVMSELYTAEEKIRNLSVSLDSAQHVFKLMHVKIQEKTGIPDSVFRKSLAYYTDHPSKFQKIYAVLIDSLTLYQLRTNLTPPETPEAAPAETPDETPPEKP